MNLFCVAVGVLLIVLVLWEVFETIVLPRRVTRQFRLTRVFYRSTWKIWTAIASLRRQNKKRDMLLSFYGPLSLLMLLGFWAVTMVFAFALIHYGDGARFAGSLGPSRFGDALYLSGETLFTLGLGDILPASPLSRFITVLEAGIGFGLLALVMGYLPVLYQSFSRRESSISLLDSRAGTPPTACEMLRRHSGPDEFEVLAETLREWEHWAADVMESHLSYPVLAYFRSQHDNQSWISALTAILDVCALSMVGLKGMCQYQARMTFAIARHAMVDLSQVFGAPPEKDGSQDRLPAPLLAEIREHLRESGLILTDGAEADAELKRIRGLYEPYAFSLARYLRLELPPWMKRQPSKDNWQTTAWRQVEEPKARRVAVPEEHF